MASSIFDVESGGRMRRRHLHPQCKASPCVEESRRSAPGGQLPDAVLANIDFSGRVERLISRCFVKSEGGEDLAR